MEVRKVREVMMDRQPSITFITFVTYPTSNPNPDTS
jgi:hypothetical protein